MNGAVLAELLGKPLCYPCAWRGHVVAATRPLPDPEAFDVFAGEADAFGLCEACAAEEPTHDYERNGSHVAQAD